MSEREKFHITAAYYKFATGELEKSPNLRFVDTELPPRRVPSH